MASSLILHALFTSQLKSRKTVYELIHYFSILLCEVSDSDLQRNFWPSLPRAGETIHQSSGLTSGKKNCVHQTFGCCRVSVALPSLKICIPYSISSSTLAQNLSVVFVLFCFLFCLVHHAGCLFKNMHPSSQYTSRSLIHSQGIELWSNNRNRQKLILSAYNTN